MPTKLEPEFGQTRSPQAAEMPKPQISRPQPQAQSAAPKGLRIERPRGEEAPAPRRLEVQPRARTVEMAEAPESLTEDDLEIPAFLRRRAN